ncbi:3-hydroxyacyl-CoA dehydrogenase family protein [uncultured Thiodictyon sp.]|uniref:3-hydroxyacyl-CoA dehydrogenase family protein n=1 Tax=uncultured Thiodictyon sp. TaxID=1846217 RepID=UPI0025E912CB|nr:3-hydroxyacyl-CoA dehydrogenase family protein [uncultured Thiodictyon sp.]
MTKEPFDTVCIIGAGFMGTQIGLQCAAHGYTVRLVDCLEECLQRSAQSHSQELEQWRAKGYITADEPASIISRISFSRDLHAGVFDAGLVIESVPEVLEIKRAIFSQLDAACAGHTIFASNSSSLRISSIESATGRPGKVLNMHFYSSPWQRAMVELMKGTATSDETMASAAHFARAIGLTPLLVLRESTGFIFNRVWRAIKKECLQLVDSGVASAADVDRAWMIANHHRVGPFGLMDMVGLDVVRDIEMVYFQESGDQSDAPPRLLLEKIEKGQLGVKTGQGFYAYPNPAYNDPAWLRGATDAGF